MLTPDDILGPQGRIAARLPGYEHRPQQMELARAVADAVRSGRHLIAEAGTGVGKSFGYLVPAILYATEDQAAPRTDDEEAPPPRRIVVSTHTISLQEQLLSKDLPLLNAVIPREFTSVLVKGRSNYLSRRRLSMAGQRASKLFSRDDDFDQLHRLADWTKHTADGSLAELPFRPAPSVWDEVASDADNCLGRNCPTYNQCFYYQARRRVQHAQLLIVNHALFCSDLALRRVGAGMLPPYDVAILDEAHTLEAVAGDHLGLRISSSQLDYLFSKLYNDRTNKGLLVHHQLRSEQEETDRCRVMADEFFADVFDWLRSRGSATARVRQSEIVANRLSPVLEGLGKRLGQVGQNFDDEKEKIDFVSARNRLAGLAREIDAWVQQSSPDFVYWVELQERRRGGPRVTLAAAPLDVGPTLREHLFDKTQSVVLTSATLAVGKPPSFAHLQSRVGLTQTRTLRVGSPFDYAAQARIILVRGLPDPGQQKAEFERRVPALVRRYVARTDGHAFVLVTSYEALRRLGQELTPWLVAQGLALYSQADGVPRTQLLEQFKENPRGVLLGTDSFWQGVDVPGDALQNVIIPKLPFSVPDQPLLEARLDAIRARGGQPFTEHQLPEAVIKLRQGFGRLIRTGRDRGIVVILDPRIRTKNYGRVFLDSLPDCPVVDEPAE